MENEKSNSDQNNLNNSELDEGLYNLCLLVEEAMKERKRLDYENSLYNPKYDDELYNLCSSLEKTHKM